MTRSLTGSPDMDALIPAATSLVWAVKTLNPADVDAALNDVIAAAGGPNLRTLAILLAAMVPDDQPPSKLLAWLEDPNGYQRMRSTGLSVDDALDVIRMQEADHAC